MAAFIPTETNGKVRPAPPCTMVIFGAAGDLAKRLLVPALCHLAKNGLLDDAFEIIGIDRAPDNDRSFRDMLKEAANDEALASANNLKIGTIDPAIWAWMDARVFYSVGDLTDPALYQQLAKRLGARQGRCNALFYLAIAPQLFGDVIDQLVEAGLMSEQNDRFRRVVIEKPFGVDLESACALNRRILTNLRERQIYRIDHFLGKETVRNILVTRFGNGMFEPLWNRLHIDHVQITAAEAIGVEQRGAFYDKTGALRDMVPSHLFQLLALIAMEPPNSFDADAVRAERERVLQAIVQQDTGEALANSARGQYRGYRQEPDVAANSNTETFVALKLMIDNWRWAGVPFYLRTGKRLSARDTEVSLQFKKAPISLFRTAAGQAPTPNVLALQIQPEEGISLCFDAKQPGPEVRIQPVKMDFKYADYFEASPSTGYETLIYDCLIGDQTLFKRAADIESGWRAVMPFLDAWRCGGEAQPYPVAGNGPRAADDLIARDGRAWRPLGKHAVTAVQAASRTANAP